MATEQQLRYLIEANDRDLKEAQKSVKELNKTLGQSEDAGNKAGKGYSSATGSSSKAERAIGGLNKAAIPATAALVGLGAAAKIGFDEIAEAQKVGAQTSAVIESTGGAANVTRKEIENLAGSISEMSGVDDEAIQAGQNMLLTFTNIRNEAGKGNDVFNQTTRTLADMSVALGVDASKQAVSLGKALNDPIKGVTALSRVGVTFTEGQKTQIKTMVDAGNTMGAQKLILAELNKEFGGSAKALGETLPGQLNKAKNAGSELAGTLTLALLPALTFLAQFAAEASAFIAEHTTFAKILIGVIAGLAAGVLVANAAIRVYTAATVAWSAATKIATAIQWLLNAALRANPIGLVITALAALVAGVILAYRNSETFRRIVTAAFEAVKTAANAVLNFFRNNWKTIAVLISGPFAPLVLLATDAFGIRSKMIAAFTAIRNFVSGVVGDIVGFFRNLPGKVEGFARDVGSAFVRGISAGLSALGGALRRLIAGPLNAIIGAWNALGVPGFDLHIGMPGPIPDINFSWGGISLPDITTLAAGGIVTGPTLAMIGEAGREAVIPLDDRRAGSLLGDAPVVQIEHYHAQDDRDPELIAAAVARKLAFR